MKKRIFGLLLCLVLALVLMQTAVYADGTYDVWVGGVQVTDANKGNILGDGKVSFDPASGRLTVKKDANITGEYIGLSIDAEGIDLTIDATQGGLVLANGGIRCISNQKSEGGSLTINGNVSVTSKTNAIWASKDLLVNGNVNAVTSGRSDKAICASSGTLTITGDVTVGGTCYDAIVSYKDLSIGGDTSVTGAFFGVHTVAGGRVTFGGRVDVDTSGTAVSSWNGIYYPTGYGITTPKGGVIAKEPGTSSYERVCEADGETVAKHVVIQPLADPYDVWVNGEQFFKERLTIPCGNGTATYDPAKGELTLENATITKERPDDVGSGIYADLDLLTVITKGYYNTITVPGNGISSTGDLTVTGEGALHLEVGAYAMEGHNVKLSGSTDVGILSNGYGIVGYKDLWITGSGGVNIQSDENALFCFEHITIEGSGISTFVSLNFEGIYARGAVRISGSRSVLVAAEDDGIYASGLLTINTSGNVTVYSGGDGLISVGSQVILQNSGEVTITAERYGIYAYDQSAVLSGSGNVTVTSVNHAIRAAQNVSISGTSKVKLEPQVHGIYGKDVMITGDCDVVINAEQYSGIISERDVLLSGSGELRIESKSVAISAGSKLTVSGDRSVSIISYVGDAIAANGNVDISGTGDLTILTTQEGIASPSNITLSTDGDVTIIALNAIDTDNNITLSGSGDVSILAGSNGLYADGQVTLSGSGNVSIVAQARGIFSYGDHVILSGSGDVDVYGKDAGVMLCSSFGQVFLNGRACSISFSTDPGNKAVINTAANTSPVAGTNFSKYKVNGDPASETVTYTPKSPVRIGDVTITGLNQPMVGDAPDTDFIITNSQGYKLTGSAQWMKIVGGTAEAMTSGEVFEAGTRYTCSLTVNTNASRTFKFSVEYDAHYNPTVVYAGTFTVNGADLACTISEDLLSLSADWWGKEALGKDCGGDRSKCPLAVFTDAPGYSNWAHKGIEFCVNMGLMSGTSATTFSPKTPMSRAMLVAVLYRMDGQPGAGTTKFSDVPAGQWYSAAVSWAADKGIVSGVGEGKFNPNGNVSREQIATILFRYAGYKGYDTTDQDNLSGFADSGKVGTWFRDGMSWAVAEGLISGTAQNGKTYLTPQGDATREQVAAILMRFCENVAK